MDEEVKMINLKEKKECCGCSACKNICPKKAIVMVQDEKGFSYPDIDKKLCINCGLCNKVCPILQKRQKTERNIEIYAAMNRDSEIRIKSSSGGIFTLLAENIIKKNGIVFGVEFDKNFHTKHTYIDRIEDIGKYRGSKYIQSDIGESYNKVKAFLEEGKYVLFTGTPCQIEGLQTFLMKKYDKLYTQDIICHGVPSVNVWDKYLLYRKSIDKLNNIEYIKFRDKKNSGWNNYELSFKYDSKEVFISHNDDLFMKIFLSDIALRDSCYECKFKTKYRNSDILIADFWGIEEVFPEMNDEKGISLVIVNSKKGKELFEEIKEKLKYKKVIFEEAIKNNPSMLKCAKKNKYTEDFFDDFNEMNFNELINKYINEKDRIQKLGGFYEIK